MSFFGMTDEEQQEISVQIVKQEPVSAESSVDDMLLEAERRFAKARYYETLIKEPIFENDPSPSAVEVVAEIQRYARERLSVLLGITAEKTETEVFTPEEISILKAMAAKLLKKPELGGLQNTTPVLRKASSPNAPVLRKVSGPKKTEAAAKPAAPKPATPPKPEKNDTGEIMRIPQKDGTFREYKKVIENGKEFYYSTEGNRYTLAQNPAGEYYMRSAARQAKPVGVKPLPQLNSDAMAAVAAQHVRVAMAQDPVASNGAVNRLTQE